MAVGEKAMEKGRCSMNNSPIDVSTWTRDYHDQRHPFWWGILLLIAIEVIVVSAFIISFFYLWILSSHGSSPWLPTDVVLPPLLFPTINTVLIILCSLSMYYGGVVIERNEVMKFYYLVIFCCIAGGIVLILRWLQLRSLSLDWKHSAYASFVWTLTGFHFLHLSSAILGTAVIGWFTKKGYYSMERQLGVQVDTMYWYFVSIAWLPMYIVLYWVPRLVN